MMLILFWISLFVIFYAYLGYPFLLFIVSIFFRGETSQRALKELPRVSLLISAYNEEKVIGDKIENSLSLDYPKELLEIVVISDGSDDRTEEIVKRYTNPGVILRSYGGRIGKTACLNKAVPIAKGDIIVFSDANSNYDKYAIKELMKHFSDFRIGFVTGHTKYVAEQNDKLTHSTSIYSRLEAFTKTYESKIGSCVGADGAIFAIRKTLHKNLKSSDINDLVVPFHIIKQGYRGMFEEKAVCLEETPRGDGQGFHRQIRIGIRTIRAIASHLELMNPFRFGFFSLQLFSHKVCKLLVPFLLIICLFSNVFLVSEGLFYVITLLSQISLYSLSLLDYWLGARFLRDGLSSFLRSFVLVNLAFLLAWISVVRGERYTTWTPSRYKS